MNYNDYEFVYVNQAGSGIGSFSGIRYQRGKGFIGSLLKNAALPLMKYFGRRLVKSGVEVANDLMEGENFKTSLKRRGKQALRDIAEDSSIRARKFEQTGEGYSLKKQKLPSKYKFLTKNIHLNGNQYGGSVKRRKSKTRKKRKIKKQQRKSGKQLKNSKRRKNKKKNSNESIFL